MFRSMKGNQDILMHKRLAFCLSVLLMFCICAPLSFGSPQEEDEALIKTERRLPMLNGHRFVLTSRIQDPFVSSFVSTESGFGVAPGVDITIYDFDGEPFTTIKGDLAYMRLKMTYRQALTDWLSLWLNVDGLGRMGINAESIVSQGLTGVFGLELGGLGRLWQNDRFMLSASASYNRGKYFGVDILTFAQRIILEGGIAPDNKVTKRIASNRYSAGLHFAYAPSDWLGLLASVEIGSTDSIFDKENRESMLIVAGMASFDLNPRTRIPLGFNLGFNYMSYPENADDLIEYIREVLFKIAYTGRREFSVGLEGSYLRAPMRLDDNTLSAWSGEIALRYYF